MKKLLFLVFVYVCVAPLLANAQGNCQQCSTSTRTQSCIDVNGSQHCFCWLSNGKCNVEGCPCRMVGNNPPMAECFCPSPVPTVESVRVDMVKQFGNPDLVAPHQLIVIHTSKSGCKDQPTFILGMIQAAQETHHPIVFTSLNDNESPPELVGK